VTATGSGYSAAYDAAGNMTCRAPSNATTCSGTQTGQQLSYDAEGHLSTWQNQPTPTSTVNYLYDGEGTRVASQLVSGGNTTLTSYIGNLETVVTGSSTTTYYSAGGLRIAEAVNGTFSYLGNDVLGSVAVALDASGQSTAAQLYGPYGNVRYSSGTMPTDIGFTGQRGDSATGLDYYGTRYYDPVMGQFISADTVLPGNGFNPWGLSRYAYVKGNPETLTDPTGQRFISSDGSQLGPIGNPTRPASGPATSSGEGRRAGGTSLASYRAPHKASYSTGVRAANPRYLERAKEYAYIMALDIEVYRSLHADLRKANYAAGWWFITDDQGNDIPFVGGPGNVGKGMERSSRDPNDPNHEGDAEQKLLREWDGSFNELAAFSMLKFLWTMGIKAQLHVVLFTQLAPCGPCKDYFKSFMNNAAAMITALTNVGRPSPFQIGDVAMTLDVYTTGGRFKGDYPYPVLFPGMVWFPGDVKDVIQGDVTKLA